MGGGAAVAGAGAVVEGIGNGVGRVTKFGSGGRGFFRVLFQIDDFAAAGAGLERERGLPGGLARGGKIERDVFALADDDVAGFGPRVE